MNPSTYDQNQSSEQHHCKPLEIEGIKTITVPDEEIRIRIAEWMGYKRTDQKTWNGRETWEKDGKLYAMALCGNDIEAGLDWLPAYTTSLDAIASAEARLTDTQHNAYRLQIIHTLAEDQGVPWSDIYGNGRVWFSALSRIRARALLRIINSKNSHEQ